MVSCAQNSEDIILYRAFKHKPPGTYVDLGSGHPLFGSVTRHLADRLHWKGIEVEANSELCRLLEKFRRNSVVLNVAVSDKEGIESFTLTPQNWAMSALTSTANASQFMEEENLLVKEVKTKSLNSILVEAKVIPNFELLKVDIEGAEMKVFKDFDFKYWKPKVIVTEIVTPHNFTKIDSLKILIGSQGYKECLFDGINSFFVLIEEKDLLKNLSIPANVHDKYIPLIWWDLLPNTVKVNYREIIRDLEKYQ